MKKILFVLLAFFASANLVSANQQDEIKKWVAFNQNPFKKFTVISEKQFKRDRQGLKILGLNKQEIDKVMSIHIPAVTKKVQTGFCWNIIRKGDKFTKMIFGEFRVWENIVVSWNRKVAQAARVYSLSDGRELWYPIYCGNWALRIEKKSTPPKAPSALRILTSSEFPIVPVFSITREKEKKIAACSFDLYIGGGIYESDHYSHEGWYFWGKTRYRPFEFNVTDTTDACLGVFAYGGLGGGDDQNYDYSWKKWAIGPSLKLVGQHWDSDLDLGLGKLYSDGEDGLYKSEQVDNIFLFSSHLNLYNRRDKGEAWLPKTELNLEFILPYDKSHNHSSDGQQLSSNPYDNKTLELILNQSIYDYEINNHLLLTPGFNLGFIKEFGRDNPNFLQFGPRITMTWHSEDIVSVSLLNYKENLGGNGDQWHWLSGHLSIGGLVKAYRVSRISEATDEDLVTPRVTN